LRRAGKGHVINISAIVGYSSFQGWGVYAATKFAVKGLTESLAIELAPLGIFATAVESGFFRTNFLEGGSLKRTKNVIGAYAATVGAMREFATSVNHHQPGDPKKLAKAVLELADSAKPPVRLPLGADTVAKIEEKNRFVEAELAQWRSVALSTPRRRRHDELIAVPAATSLRPSRDALASRLSRTVRRQKGVLCYFKTPLTLGLTCSAPRSASACSWEIGGFSTTGLER
jgi:hypothetical protein